MEIEELRAKVVELQDKVDSQAKQLNEVLENNTLLQSENKVLKEYNQKFFERIPKTLVDNDPTKVEKKEEPAKVSFADFKNNIKKEIKK